MNVVFSITLLGFLGCSLSAVDSTQDASLQYSELDCSEFAKSEPNYRSCRVQNACFHEGQWILLLPHSTRWSTVKPLLNLGSYSSSPTFEFGSAINKTVQEFTDAYQPIWIDENVVYTAIGHHLYWHWVMDDLFSLHWMLKHYSWLDQDYTLILPANFQTRYSRMVTDIFTKEPPISIYSFLESQKQARNSSSSSICFKNMILGPAAHHVGGPGKTQVKTDDIRDYSSFLQTKIGLQAFPKVSKPLITIIQRKGDREIANKEEFVKGVENFGKQKGIDVKAVIMESLSYKEQIELMQRTTTLIAVHGSAMTNIIFLPQQASIVEIFPYGFERPTYQFLAKELKLNYLLWRNPHKHNAIFHPEILDRFPLSDERRNAIKDAEAYSHSMEWAGNMYWINQDTIVNVTDFNQVLEKAIKSPNKK